jgi:hypothetical protein
MVRAAHLGAGRGRSPPSRCLFCDLNGFTAFADRRGDGAAGRIIDRFAAIVTAERCPDVGRTKLLGDGFMCAHPNARLAVEARRPDHCGRRPATQASAMAWRSRARATTPASPSTSPRVCPASRCQ